jgi:hypothetical protein
MFRLPEPSQARPSATAVEKVDVIMARRVSAVIEWGFAGRATYGRALGAAAERPGPELAAAHGCLTRYGRLPSRTGTPFCSLCRSGPRPLGSSPYCLTDPVAEH